MRDTSLTRRRVVQGAGAIGLIGLGSTVTVAQQDGGGGQEQGAAIRFVHASPDAPNVNVRLTSSGGTTGNQTANGTAGNQTDNESIGNQTDTETTGNQSGGGQTGAETTIEGLSFRDVSNYQEVDPGTYQVEVVTAGGGGVGGFIDDLFGGGEEQENTVLYEDQLTIEEGTTYTAVAFGEVSQGPVQGDGSQVGNETTTTPGNETTTTPGNETTTTPGNETMGNETTTPSTTTGGVGGGSQSIEQLAFGEYQTLELDAGDYTLMFQAAGATGTDTGTTTGTETTPETETNETTTPADGATGSTGSSGSGFQVQVIEDDITDPGDQSARLRVFHAVPDVETVSVTATPAGQNGAANDTGTAANDTGTAVNDTGITDNDSVTADNETAATDGGANATGTQGADQGQQVEFTAEGGTVYSGFALGYFNPESATTAGQQDGNATTDGNVTGDENATADGNATGDENATADGNATGGENTSDGGILLEGDNATESGNQTEDSQGGDLTQDAQAEEFGFVTVEDAQGGERSDGGSDGLFEVP